MPLSDVSYLATSSIVHIDAASSKASTPLSNALSEGGSKTDFTDLETVTSEDGDAVPIAFNPGLDGLYSVVFVNGRQYTASCPWPPTDEESQSTLILQHQQYERSFEHKLYDAPIPFIDQQHVLEVGCGMGDWTQQYALQHPNAIVLGTEPALLPIPPPGVQNCSFAHHDFASGPVEFTHQSFDFIRGNRLDGRVNNWSGFLDRAWRSLKCGGFIELYDVARYHVPVGANHPWADVPKLFGKCGGMIERSFGFTSSGQLRTLMGTTGFVNVTESWKCIPIEASDDVGRGILATLLDEIDALVRIAMQGSFNETAHEAYMASLRSSLYSLTLTSVTVWAQKPFEIEVQH